MKRSSRQANNLFTISIVLVALIGGAILSNGIRRTKAKEAAPSANTSAITTLACTPPPPGLVSWWPGENNANDIQGTNLGTLQNGVTFVPGQVGQAFNLNGSNQYVLIGDPVPSALQVQNEITLAAWIFVTAYPSDLGVIIGSQHDASQSGATIMLDGRTNPDGQPSPPGHIHFQIGDGSWHTSNANAQVPLNQWVHIAATRKANEDAKIYYNGVLQPVTSAPWSGAISYDGGWFAIGQQKDMNRAFNGQIDEPEVYNRALSAAEIQSIFSAGTAGKCQTPAVSIVDAQVMPGTTGTKQVNFTVNVARPDGSSIDVNYQTANGTAFAGIDYVATSGTLHFAANETSKTIPVTVNGLTRTSSQSFTVTLSSPVNAVINRANATGTIFTGNGVNDYRSVNDSNQTWQYGYTQTNGSGFSNYILFEPSNGTLAQWRRLSSDMAVVKNVTNHDINYNSCTLQPADVLAMFPGNDGRKTVLRWKAPEAGTFNITGRFQNADQTTSDISIIKNGVTVSPLFTDVINGGACNAVNIIKPFALNVTVNAGDVIDFRVGWGDNGAFQHDGTGLAVSIEKAQVNQTITVNTHAPANAVYNSQFTVAATSNSNLAVSYSSAGSCTNVGPLFTMTSGTGTCTVKYDQAGDNNYNAATQIVETVSAQKASLTITANDKSREYRATDPTFTYTPSGFVNGDTVSVLTGAPNLTTTAINTSNVGPFPINATAGTLSAANYAFSFVAGTLTITKATPAISWSNPADIVYGTALSSTQLNATATNPNDNSSVTGTFTYTPASGTQLNAGSSQALHVDLVPTDTTNYNSASKDVSINVQKADQTINFGAIADRTFGDADFGISATASSTLTVAFGITGQCTLSGLMVHITGAGTCTVTASQAGDNNYNAAPNVPRPFNIAKAAVTVTLGNLTHTADGNPKFATATTNPTGLNVIISYSQGGSPVAAPTNVGNYDVLATINEANYQGSVTGVLVINSKITPTINWNNPADITFGTALSATQLNATTTNPNNGSSVPGTFTYTPALNTVLNAGTAQTLHVDFTPTDGSTFNTAAKNVSVNVLKANQTINFASLPGKTFGDADFNVSATSTSNLAVTFAASGQCTISGDLVHITAAGSCTITASQSGNSNFNAAPNVPQVFSIAKANQTITFGTLANKTINDPDFNITASASSGLTVSFTATGQCTVTGSTVHLIAAGSCTITASQSGDTNFNAATNIGQAFTIAKANQTITFGALANKTFGDPPFNVNAIASSGLPVGFSILSGPATINGTTVTLTGTGQVVVRANQAGNNDYNPAPPVDQPFDVTGNPLPAPCNPVLTGMSAWYKGDGNANDSSGAGNGATANNGVAFDTGRFSQSFKFDGVNDYLSVPDSSTLRPASGLTIEGWIKIPAGVDGSRWIVQKNNASGVSFGLGYASVSSIKALVFSLGRTGSGLVFNAVSDRWYHIALTFDDPSDTLHIYIDGIDRGATTWTDTLTHDNSPMTIGARIQGGVPQDFFMGHIDDLAIYHRALSGPELRAIINAGSAGKCGAAAPVVPAPTPTPTPTPTPSPSPSVTFNLPTNPGNNVTLLPSAGSINFASVTTGGTTTMTSMPPSSAGLTPTGFVIDGSSLAFEISTTASVTAPILVCFNVTSVTNEAAFNRLRMLHGENGVLVDRTTSRNFPARQICGQVSSLSPFLVATYEGSQVESPQGFVDQHYRDFLSREADPSGLAFWTNEITSCGTDQQCVEVKRINVSAAFYLSIEFNETGYLVERLYKTAYGDGTGVSTIGGSHQLAVPIVRFDEFLPDTQQIGQGVVVGQPGWEQLLAANKLAFVLAFVQRSRFTDAYPTSLTPAQFVDALFAKTGITPSTADRQVAIDEFGGAANSSDNNARSRALLRVAQNPTFAQTEFSRAFVLMEYFGYLRRNPNDAPDVDYSGYDFWLTKLNQFNGNFIHAEMVKAFISSIEYRERFGSN